MKKLTFGLLLAAFAVVAAPGCKKTLDVNQNSNALPDVSARQLLSSAQVQISQAYGNYFQIVGGIWGQYWTQNPSASQYKNLDQYEPGPSSANTAWSLLYAGALTDLQKLIDKNESANYTAVAMMLKAYTFQLLTDNFNDIPYSEALRAEEGVTNPKYDPQAAVYMGIIDMTKQALALIDPDGLAPENDVIFGGDMAHWEEFGNTLLLRMYLRLAYVNPGMAQQGVQSLNGAAFLQAGTGADVVYTTTAGNNNPLYSESHTIGTQNLIASATAIDSLRDRSDPRLTSFYFNNNSGFRGLRQGNYNAGTTTAYAYPGAAVGGIANPTTTALESASQAAPVRLLSSYESLFLQAEAAARGWLSASGSDQDLLEEAIRDNMDYYATGPDSLIDQYITDNVNFPVGGMLDDRLRVIITEKYYAMCGNQNIEAWTEWRRTGFPTFFQISIAPGAGTRFPARLPYPETELTRNNSFPGQKEVFDRVYWDVN